MNKDLDLYHLMSTVHVRMALPSVGSWALATFSWHGGMCGVVTLLLVLPCG